MQTKTVFYFISIMMLSLISLQVPAQVELWRTSINGNNPDFPLETCQKVVFDPISGSVYSGGDFTQPDGDNDCMVVKMDATTGDTLWTWVTNWVCPSQPYSRMWDIAIDSNGDIVAVGKEVLSAVPGSDQDDWVVVKLDKDDGSEIWLKYLHLNNDAVDAGICVEIDSENNVITGGAIGKESSPIQNFAIFKLNGNNGDIIWEYIIDEPSSFMRGYTQELQLDNFDNVVAGGFLSGIDDTKGIRVIAKLSGNSGQPEWRFTDTAKFIVFNPVDPDERFFSDLIVGEEAMYFCGCVDNSSDSLRHFNVKKLNLFTGAEIWSTFLENPYLNVYSIAQAISLDENEDLYVCGSVAEKTIDPTVPSEFIVAKFDHATGGVIWQYEWTEYPDEVLIDRAYDIKVHPNGLVYVTGSAYQGGNQFELFDRMALARLDATTGEMIWEITFTDAYQYEIANGWSYSLDFNTENNEIFIGGMLDTHPSVTHSDYTVIKIFDNTTRIDNANLLNGLSTLLDQNYPNPCSSYTEIGFMLTAPDNIRISVYDQNGRLINTLCEAYYEAGHHSVTWNCDNSQGQKVVSGNYFYRIDSKYLSQTRKCIVVR